MTGPIATLVDDALRCVEAEHPTSYAELVAALGHRRLDLEIDDEHFMVAFESELHGPVVSISTDLATISGVLHAEIDLMQAILSGNIDAVGSADDLVATATGLHRFVQGAVRCVSMTALMDRLETLRRSQDAQG